MKHLYSRVDLCLGMYLEIQDIRVLGFALAQSKYVKLLFEFLCQKCSSSKWMNSIFLSSALHISYCLGQKLLCFLVMWDIAGSRFCWKITYSVENSLYVDRLQYGLDASVLMKATIDTFLLFFLLKEKSLVTDLVSSKTLNKIVSLNFKT